jgi:hypothetical protein
VIALLWLLTTVPLGTVYGQSYRMPAGDDDHASFYVTAYLDHGSSTDWNCGGLTYSGHQGSDFGVGSWSGMEAGRDIVAAADGVVGSVHDGEFDECSSGDCDGGGGYGNHVRIDHADGRETLYAHMKKWSVAVTAGQAVSCGTLIGQVGSSGYSTGPHLHFELRSADNDRVDPFVGACSSGTSSWVSQGTYDSLPAPTCDEPVGECQTTRVLTCGDSISDRNDIASATTDHWFYGCEDFTYSGSEVAYEILTDRTEPVTVSLTGLSADLDLYLLASAACDGSDCLAASSEPDASDEQATATATAGVPLVAVIDGWEGATSDYTITVACEGSLPKQDTGEPRSTLGDSGASVGDTGASVGDTSPTESWNRVEKPAGGGLGCSLAAATGHGLAWLLALIAVQRRRSG